MTSGTSKPSAWGASDLVLVVDDDPSMREALARLFKSVGLASRMHASSAEFSATPDWRGNTACCLVLDVRLPGLSGLDLQGQLGRAGDLIPIIFMSGHGDIPMSVQAIKAGAVDFLCKPFRDQEMLDAVALALQRDRNRRLAQAALADLRARRAGLTRREAQVMDQVVLGLLNKQIAGLLGLSEITVKIHRGHMMQKMQARTVVELLRMADQLNGETGLDPSA